MSDGKSREVGEHRFRVVRVLTEPGGKQTGAVNMAKATLSVSAGGPVFVGVRFFLVDDDVWESDLVFFVLPPSSAEALAAAIWVEGQRAKVMSGAFDLGGLEKAATPEEDPGEQRRRPELTDQGE